MDSTLREKEFFRFNGVIFLVVSDVLIDGEVPVVISPILKVYKLGLQRCLW